MDSPEVEAHPHRHKTGISWLDLSLALSAFTVSIISLFVAIHHGDTMKAMAEANSRMVEASVWPYVEYGTGNRATDGSPFITMSISDQGVGPARIEKFQILYDGKPVKSTMDFLNACCIRGPLELQGILPSDDFKAAVVSAPVQGRILTAHDSITFLGLARTAKNAAVWDRLNKERFEVQAQICFCSVFDECWTNGKLGEKANKVKECPADWVGYVE